MRLLLFLCSFLLSAGTLSAETVTLNSSNTLQMNTYYNQISVGEVMQSAIELHQNLPAGEPFYLVINSGGGYISAGLEMIQFLNGLGREVHTITMYAASMGFETVQGLYGKRLILNTGSLMSHRASGGFYGEFPNGNLDTRYKFWLSRLLAKDLRVVERNTKLKSLKQYRALIANEYWCEGQACVSDGFADQVVSAKCDESLSKILNKDSNIVMSGYPIVLRTTESSCPLQPYTLSWNLYYQGKPLWTKPQEEGATNYMDYDLFGDRKTTMEIIKRVGKYIQSQNQKTPIMVVK